MPKPFVGVNCRDYQNTEELETTLVWLSTWDIKEWYDVVSSRTVSGVGLGEYRCHEQWLRWRLISYDIFMMCTFKYIHFQYLFRVKFLFWSFSVCRVEEDGRLYYRLPVVVFTSRFYLFLRDSYVYIINFLLFFVHVKDKNRSIYRTVWFNLLPRQDKCCFSFGWGVAKIFVF